MASTTTNFSFTRLEGTDKAGYNSINTLIDSIDIILNPIMPPIGSVIVFNSSLGASIPTGWATVTPTSSGLPVLNAPYSYIQRSA